MSVLSASSSLAVKHHCANNLGADLVALLGTGDIDRPVVVGGQYNGQDAPPFAAGINSGVNGPKLTN